MTNVRKGWLKFWKRHSEVVWICAFLFSDAFLSGPQLAVGSSIAALWVFLPAFIGLLKFKGSGRIAYVKAFLRTPKVHRLGIILFWLWGIRWLVGAAVDANLLACSANTAESPGLLRVTLAGLTDVAFSKECVNGSQVPVALLIVTPLVIYSAACAIAVGLRSRLRSRSNDPDLITQRKGWVGVTHTLFLSAFIASVLSITLNANGPGYMLSNWLLASARDANIFCGETMKDVSKMDSVEAPTPLPEPDAAQLNLYPLQNTSGITAPMLSGVLPICPLETFVKDFDAILLGSLSSVLIMWLWQPITRLNAFLTSFCWRVVSPTSPQNIVEAFLEALHLPSRSLQFKEAYPLYKNAARTLVWILACYAGLFWLLGFCGGPLGHAIQNWMMASVGDAGLIDVGAAPDWVFEPRLRIFLASFAALIGSASLAVSTAVILPYAKTKEITINSDGMLFAQGPFLSLWGRQFRLWSDLKEVAVRELADGRRRIKFTLTFRSGGHVSFDETQVCAADLRVLLDSIDQYAVSCQVDPRAFSLFEQLKEAQDERNASDGKTETGLTPVAVENFRSTIFVPLAPGDFVPNTTTRIIRQLSSKPLCAVYLGRNDEGKMITVKQFYLAAENEETKALSKLFTREFELLSAIDHPSIAKVIGVSTNESSTFLQVEHKLGIDLRDMVEAHGPRPEKVILNWAKQLCEIMSYLHGKEPIVLHRDLTPDNIIIGEDGQIRLIDFGAAREFADGITGTMIGKHCYMAPEQLRGDATPISDIYSFGGTLYFLLTGRDPIPLSQSSASECSEELEQLIKDCTEFDQEKRPQSFNSILARINEIGKGRRLKLPSAKEKIAAS